MIKEKLEKILVEKDRIAFLKRKGLFDQEYYINNTPDLDWENLNRKITPIQHFTRHGIYEGRWPSAPHKVYQKWLNARRKSRFDIKEGLKAAMAIKKSGFFDEEWYLQKYPDVRKFTERNKKLWDYLKKNQMWVAFHYIKHGINETRLPFPGYNEEHIFIEYMKEMLFDLQKIPVLYWINEHKKGFDVEEYLTLRKECDISQVVLRMHSLHCLEKDNPLDVKLYSTNSTEEFWRQNSRFFRDESIMLVIQDENINGISIQSADRFFNSNVDMFKLELNKNNCLIRKPESDINNIFKDAYEYTNYILKVSAGGCVVRCPGKGHGIKETELTKVQKEERKKIKECIYYNTKDLIASQINLKKIKWKIIISFYGFDWGGGEIMPLRIANELKRQGHAVLVHVQSNKTVPEVRKMLRNDIPVVCTEDKTVLCSIVDCNDVNVINSHHVCTNSFMAYIMSMDTKFNKYINHIATSHGMLDEAIQRGDISNVREMLEGISEYVDSWTYVADKNLYPFKLTGYYYPEYLFKIPNGMEMPDFKKVEREALNIDKNAFVFCTVSRGIREKGWKEGIDAICEARKATGMDIHFVIVGTGEMYDVLKSEVDDRYIHMVGHKNNPCDYYMMSDACLFPSFFPGESAPLSIIESMFAGKPIIASNIGDIASMITLEGEKCGYLFDLNEGKVSIESISELIVKLVKDKEEYRRMAELAVKKCQTFEIGNVAERYISIYERKMYKNKILANK